jgi:lipopolysaccharide heptosyltransferase I
MADFRRILLIKPSSLGDIVHTLPIVAALKDRWPAAHLTWVVKRQWADLVERAAGVDRVWPVEVAVESWLGQVRALRAERFDLAVDLQGLFRSGALAWLSGASLRIGLADGREGSPWFYTHRVPVPTGEMHAVDRYLLVAAALGARPQGTPQFRFKMLDEDMTVVREVVGRKGSSVDNPWVAMNVSARWPTKRWPLSSFAVVLDRLHKEGLGPVVVIGSPDEQHHANQLRALTKSPFIDLTGVVPLGCLPALLSKAALVITNDSGPMHIAAAVGTPVVALFGPTSAARTGPYGEGHRALARRVPCSPCFSRVCRHSPEMECLHLIQPNDVVEAARHLLTAPTISR